MESPKPTSPDSVSIPVKLWDGTRNPSEVCVNLIFTDIYKDGIKYSQAMFCPSAEIMSGAGFNLSIGLLHEEESRMATNKEIAE